jgi:hypothetical protein
MSDQPTRPSTASDLLATWRAAERDTVAAHGAARIAELALIAAASAEEAATEVEAAAAAALEAVNKAREAASRARSAAAQAAEAAHLALVSAEADKTQTNHDVAVAQQAEAGARGRFHAAEEAAFDRQRSEPPSDQ